jgi:SNF2 family DNA or RNA helicase
MNIDPSWKSFKLTFGKYSGYHIYEVFVKDPGYVRWLAKEFSDSSVKNAAIAILAGNPIPKTEVMLDFIDNKIVITCPYELKDICSNLSIREWNGKNWVCPSNIINEVINAFQDYDTKITNNLKIEQDRIATIQKMSNAIDSDFVMSNEFGGEKNLYKYQLTGAKFIEMSNGCSMINDSVGLGKSAQALSYVYNHSAMRPVIIICPASIKYQWDGYCREWIPDCNPQVINRAKEEIIGDIVILNYDILKKNLNSLKDINPQILILDESHKVKNYQSQRTIAAVDLASQIPHRMLLSGKRPNGVGTIPEIPTRKNSQKNSNSLCCVVQRKKYSMNCLK